MKPTPKTHKTRGGYPWRDLELVGVRTGYILVAVLSSPDYEEVFSINIATGKAESFSRNRPQFDLIPIKREHGLPKNVDNRWQWAAKDKDGDVVLYESKPKHDTSSWTSCGGGGGRYVPKSLYPNALKDFDWEDSLHRCLDSGDWVHIAQLEKPDAACPTCGK